MAEMVHSVRVIHQSIIHSRECIANGRRKYEGWECKKIVASHFGISASKVLQDEPLAEEEDDGRDEMGIDVDRLVVEIRPAAERSAGRARNGPVTMKNPLVVVVLKPFRHLVEREKGWMSCLAGPGPGPGCVVFFHSWPFARFWLLGQNSETGSGGHLPSRLVTCNVWRPAGSWEWVRMVSKKCLFCLLPFFLFVRELANNRPAFTSKQANRLPEWWLGLWHARAKQRSDPDTGIPCGFCRENRAGCPCPLTALRRIGRLDFLPIKLSKILVSDARAIAQVESAPLLTLLSRSC